MAKKYRTLKQQFHASDKDTALALYRARFHSESALTWNFTVGEHQLFCLVTPTMTRSIERIVHHELENFALWGGLPRVAQRSWAENLIMDEIVATNDIEGVRSTRQEIGEAIAAIKGGTSPKNRRFLEMARLYLGIVDGKLRLPETATKLRVLYDDLLVGEIADEDQLDGELFRNEPVHIFDGSNEKVHSGLTPESTIIDAVNVMFTVMADQDVPRLIAAIVSHFMFEYIHPFYDGNGRVGRFMFGLSLTHLLSIPTALSLSQVINKQKNKYYKAFMEVEEPLNYGEVTPFVLDLLELIEAAQSKVTQQLRDYKERMDQLEDKLRELEQDNSSKMRKHTINILFILGQESIFGSAGGVILKDLAEMMEKSEQQTRRYLQDLEQEGAVEATATKPKRYKLSDHGRKYLELV